MWFFLAILLLWGATATYSNWDPWVVQDIVKWGLWTAHLYAVATAALYEPKSDLLSSVACMLGYSLFAIYFVSMSATYLTFLPHDPGNPNLWPTVFLSINLVGPILLTTVGCMSAGVQRGK